MTPCRFCGVGEGVAGEGYTLRRTGPDGHAPWCAEVRQALRDLSPSAEVPPGVVERPGRCGVDDCTYASHARGMCVGHYNRFFRHGDPRKGTPVLSPANVRARAS